METALNNSHLPRNVNARAFAAGTGVTTALIAAAVVAFVSIAAFVAFEGIPFKSDGSPESSVSISSGAPQAAALTAGSAAESVAADPATPSAAALAEITAALPPGAATDGFGGGAGPGGPTTDGPPTGTGPGGGGTGGGTGGGGDDGVPAPGPIQGTVGSLDDAVGGLGLDLPLSETTGDITKNLDDTLNGTLNNVVNGIGAGKLGDKVNNTVGSLTNGLLD